MKITDIEKLQLQALDAAGKPTGDALTSPSFTLADPTAGTLTPDPNDPTVNYFTPAKAGSAVVNGAATLPNGTSVTASLTLTVTDVSTQIGIADLGTVSSIPVASAAPAAAAKPAA